MLILCFGQGNHGYFPVLWGGAQSFIVTAVVVLWLEIFLDVAGTDVVGLPLMLWTGLVFFVIWVFSLLHLVLLKASHTYILRNDSLEIGSGILTSKSFVLSPSGFSDLEVVRSVSARIINSGDIVIRTQSETDSVRKMVTSEQETEQIC